MGNKEERLLSQQFYAFLCDVVGNEKMVRSRRTFFKTYDYFSCVPAVRVLSSGSLAEGLFLPGSDFDVMAVCEPCPVYDSPEHILKHRKTSGLLVDTSQTPPGFANIKVYGKDSSILIFGYHSFIIENETLLSNCIKIDILNIYKLFLTLSNMGINSEIIAQLHGPCVSDIFGTSDMVFCLRCLSWPKIASSWFDRPRSAWPPANVMSEIHQEDVLLVPIGSKFGAVEDNTAEWRMSFSVAEKMLVHSFNHTQLLCYAMLKMFLREVLNKKSKTKNLLCSYFMKTVLFWVIEESDNSQWMPQHLLYCFRICLKRLIYIVQIGYCPNYFIPENNMFEGKIFGRCQDDLLLELQNIYVQGFNFVLQLETFSKFLIRPPRRVYDKMNYKKGDEEKAVFPLIQFVNGGFCNCNKILAAALALSSRLRKSNLCKNILSLFISDAFLHKVDTTVYLPMGNKQRFHEYRVNLCDFLIGAHSNGSGWVLVASLFYEHKQYNRTLKVLEFVLSECSPDKQHIWPFQPPGTFKSNSTLYKTGLKFLDKYKLSCLRVICRFNFPETLFYDSELNMFGNWTCIGPKTLTVFMKLMCYHHLQYNVEKICAFNELLQIYYTEDIFGIFYVSKALELTKPEFDSHPKLCNIKPRLSAYSSFFSSLKRK